MAAGYSNDKAYYIGNAALNAIEFSGKTVQICAGIQSSCAVDCHEINAQQVGSQITSGLIDFPSPAPNSNFKKLIAAWAGLSRFQHAGDYFWCGVSDDSNGCTLGSTWNGPWGSSWASCQGSSSYVRGASKHVRIGIDAAWHIWGCGVTMYIGANVELDIWGDAGPDIFQIRYQ